MSKNERLLKACRREAVDATPVWLMRQAGRYMPEYRALRERHALLDMIKSPDLATEVTLQPVHAFDVDAAIIFADILPLLECLGFKLKFIPGRGPVIENPPTEPSALEALPLTPPEETLQFTLDAIRQTKAALGDRLPLIGFSGAPFTLACYAIEGGTSKNFNRAKALMYSHPRAWHALMEQLAEAAGRYLSAQAAAGADVLQLFDSWAGTLTPDAYREFVLPYSRRALERAGNGNKAPLIHFATGTSGWLPLIKEAGGSVIGIDWRISLSDAWHQLGNDVAVQGNLDPALLLADPEAMRAAARHLLDDVVGKPGHIFNLGHGIYKETPPEHVANLIDFVHEYTQSK